MQACDIENAQELKNYATDTARLISALAHENLAHVSISGDVVSIEGGDTELRSAIQNMLLKRLDGAVAELVGLGVTNCDRDVFLVAAEKPYS